MKSRLDVQAVLHELAKLEHDETTCAIMALFPPGSPKDCLHVLKSLDANQKAQFKSDLNGIYAEADKRFWERVRASGVNIPLPPGLSALQGPECRAMGIQVIGIATPTP